jgi:tetratricopeptide (TPR) repeat protein
MRKLTLIFLLFVISAILYAETPREYFKVAKYNFDNGEYNKALVFVNRSIDSDPKYVSSLLLRADINYTLKNFMEVIDDITLVFNIDEAREKSLSEYYLLRGEAYLELDFVDNALNDIDYSLILNPNSSMALYAKARIKYKNEHYSEAIQYLSKSITIDPSNSDLYYLRADSKVRLYKPLPGTKIYDGILADIKLSIALNPNQFDAYKLKCVMLKRDHQIDKNYLISELNTYIKVFPDRSDFYSERGKANVFKGNFNDALMDFTKAIELNEKDEINYRNRGMCFHNLNRYNQAIHDLSKSVEILIGKLSENRESKSLKKALSQTFNMRGLAYKLNNNPSEACEDFKIAAKLGSKSGLNNYRRSCNVFQ